MEDLYAILGVEKTATSEEIKSAYKKLAKQYHPDLNPGNKDAEEKFKVINSAYDILGDTGKRAQYDTPQSSGPFGGGFGGGFNGGFTAQNVSEEEMINIMNSMFGGRGFGPMFGQGFGVRSKNRDYQVRLTISLEEAYTGKSVPIQINTAMPALKIDLPAGIASGNQVKYTGHGDKSNPNLPPGDLYIIVEVSEDGDFRRMEDHLIKLIKVDAIDAILGFEQEITCINKSIIKVKIPAGIQPETKINVKGYGMPILNRPGAYGDLILTVDIVVPKLSDEAKRILRAFHEDIKNAVG